MTNRGDVMSLKPCPFCCSDDLFTQAALGCRQVVCETCEASGPTEETDEEAIEAWNRLGLSRSTSPVAPTAEQADAVRVDQSPTVTLTGAQLLAAFQFVAPDHPNDADQLECEVTIQYGDGRDGPGLYCWFTEYPEEGAIRLDAPASSTGDQA